MRFSPKIRNIFARNTWRAGSRKGEPGASASFASP